jgi:hypothetical protein
MFKIFLVSAALAALGLFIEVDRGSCQSDSNPGDIARTVHPGYAESDYFPLGFSLTRDNFAAIKKWYAEGKGEAKKFRLKDPAWYARPIEKAMMSNTDAKSGDYVRPGGMWGLSACAFAYALTGNMECGKVVKKMLLYLANLESWTPRDSIAPFNESFAVTQIAMAYDLVFPVLSKHDREAVAMAIEQKGMRPIREFVIGKHNWTGDVALYHGSPGYLQSSNQAAVYVQAIYLGASLLYHHTGDERYNREAIKAARAMRVFLENYFPEDGSVSAAPGYYLMTLEELSYVIVPMARTLGLSVADFLPKGARNPFLFAMYLRSNASPVDSGPRYPYIFPFGDSTYQYVVYDPVKRAQVGVRYWALAVWSAYVKDPNLLWMYDQYAKLPGIELMESSGSLVSHYYRARLAASVCPAEPGIDRERLFENAGLFVWRDGFNRGDKMFALWKRVYKTGDHLRYEQNSILLEAFGERYLTHRGVDYAKDKELGLSLSQNHNAVTVDGKNSLDGSSRREISPYFVSESLNYARSDASFDGHAAYILKDPWRKSLSGAVSEKSDKAVRSVMYVKPDYYVIFDAIHNVRPGTVQCNFVSAVPFDTDGRWVTYKGKDSALFQFVASPDNYSMRKRQTVDDKSAQMWALSVETEGLETEASFINLLFPVKGDSRKPLVVRKSTKAGTRMVVDRGTSRELIIQKNLKETQVSIENMATDGEAAILLYRGGELIGGGLFGGTFVEVDKRRIVSADGKCSLVFSILPENVYGRAQSDEGTRVTFDLWDKPIYLSFANTDRGGYSVFSSFR